VTAGQAVEILFGKVLEKIAGLTKRSRSRGCEFGKRQATSKNHLQVFVKTASFTAC
jgi:hypothetical protein